MWPADVFAGAARRRHICSGCQLIWHHTQYFANKMISMSTRPKVSTVFDNIFVVGVANISSEGINCLDVRTSLFKFLTICLGGFDMIWSRFLPSVPDVRQNWFCCCLSYVLTFVGHFCILSYSVHMYFFSSTQPMIPVNSCGAATIITPSTVKPRKARRLMGQSVDWARWGDVSDALIFSQCYLCWGLWLAQSC